MADEQKNINPWAEKLQDISLPDEQAVWDSMQEKLETELPTSKKKSYGRWVLLVVLLLLLLGVCNCPPGWRSGLFTPVSTDNSKGNAAGKTSDNQTSSNEVKESGTADKTEQSRSNPNNDTTSKPVQGIDQPDSLKPVTGVIKTNSKLCIDTSGNSKIQDGRQSNKKQASNQSSADFNKDAKGRQKGPLVADSNSQTGSVGHNNKPHRTKNGGNRGGNVASNKPLLGTSDNPAVYGKAVSPRHASTQKGKQPNNKDGTIDVKVAGRTNRPIADFLAATPDRNGKATFTITLVKPVSGKKPLGKLVKSGGDSLQTGGSEDAFGNDDTTSTPIAANTTPTSSAKTTDSLIKKEMVAKKDSIRNDSAQTAKSKPEKTEDKVQGWAAAAGLNQFFAINGQQRSTLSSDGITGSWKDYIPVPQLRYYFSRKLYAQIEAQFNAPQYTQNLLGKFVPADSAPSSTQTSVFVKKLFYFNLPLSIHFSPVKNLYLGAGVQFSRLTNGVAVYEERQYSGGRPDSSLPDVKTQSFKNDSLYQRLATNEWRWLVDANYHWKNFTAGARYNQAFGNFINIQVSSTQITQARNSSLQLYLRYTFWRGRRLKVAGVY